MEELVAYIELVKAGKPVVKEVLEAVKGYEEEFEQVRSFFVANVVKSKSEIFNGFVEAGLTREEALALTISATSDLVKSIKSKKGVK